MLASRLTRITLQQKAKMGSYHTSTSIETEGIKERPIMPKIHGIYLPSIWDGAAREGKRSLCHTYGA